MDFEKIEKLIKYLYINLYHKTENDALLISILKNTPRTISQNNNLIP
jgi:hypothetical protein